MMYTFTSKWENASFGEKYSTDCLLAEWLIPSVSEDLVRRDSSNLARLLECEVAASSQPFSLSSFCILRYHLLAATMIPP